MDESEFVLISASKALAVEFSGMRGLVGIALLATHTRAYTHFGRDTACGSADGDDGDTASSNHEPGDCRWRYGCSAVPIREVRAISWDYSVPAAAFIEQLAAQRAPLVVRGGPANGWPAMKRYFTSK